MRFSHIVLLGILGLALVASAHSTHRHSRGRTLSGFGDRRDNLRGGGGIRQIGGTTVGGGYLMGDRNGAAGGFRKTETGYSVTRGVSIEGNRNIVRSGGNSDGSRFKSSTGWFRRRLAGLDLERGGGSRQIGDATVGGGYLIGDRNGAIGGVVERNGEYRGVAGFDVGDRTFRVRGSMGEDGLHLKKIGGNNGRRLTDLGDRREDRQTWRGSRTIGDATVSGGLLRNDDDFGVGAFTVAKDGGFRGMGGVSFDDNRRIRRSGGWVFPEF